MNNSLEIYTKLKLKIGNEIIVTYYSKDSNKYTKEFILLDTDDLSYIYVGNNKELINLPFISPNIIIESILSKNENTPIYFNPYLNEFKNPFTHYEQIKESTKKHFTIDKKILKEQNRIINQYLAKIDIVEYNKLFFSEKQKKEFNLFFDILVQELSEYAKRKGLDSNLKKINAGTTSIVYEIGDKIIKIGKPRRNRTIPYCEYLLQPIINRIFEFDGYPIHIEVTQKALALKNQNCSANIFFNQIISILKNNLQSIGLSSNDLHPENIGILLEDNRIHFDEITFDTASNESTSIENNNNLKILPKGSFVIIDLDLLEIEDKEKYSTYLKSLQLKKRKKRILRLK